MVADKEDPMDRDSLRSGEIQVRKIIKRYTRDIIKGGAGVVLGLPCPLPLCEWL